MAPRIIGLTGKAGSGKDFVYDRLSRLFTFPVERLALADGVKFDIEETLGTTPYDLPALRTKPYTPEVRALLQWWGTDLRRAQDDGYWLKKAEESLVGAPDKVLFVVTDVRFANEALWVRDRGGIVVQVYTTDLIRRRRLGGVLPPAHASEDIDFETDATIYSPDGPPVIGPAVCDFLGLESPCFKCRTLVPHGTHDSGKEVAPYMVRPVFGTPSRPT